MRKLMSLCFVILFTVLAVLSCINYSYDGVDRIERDKQRITIEKPENITNEQFLNELASAVKSVDADIMYRYVDMAGDKPQYIYFRTTNTSNFIVTGNPYDNIPLGDKECISSVCRGSFLMGGFRRATGFAGGALLLR